MALNYEVKKRVFGFDKTKTEKYVAQLKTLGMVEFEELLRFFWESGWRGWWYRHALRK